MENKERTVSTGSQLSLSTSNTMKYLQEIGNNPQFKDEEVDMIRILVCCEVYDSLQDINSTLKFLTSLCLLTAAQKFITVILSTTKKKVEKHGHQFGKKKSREVYKQKSHKKGLFSGKKAKGSKKVQTTNDKKISRLYEGIAAGTGVDLLRKASSGPSGKDEFDVIAMIDHLNGIIDRCTRTAKMFLKVALGQISVKESMPVGQNTIRSKPDFDGHLKSFNLIMEAVEFLLTSMINQYEEEAMLQYDGPIFEKFIRAMTEVTHNEKEIQFQNKILSTMEIKPPPATLKILVEQLKVEGVTDEMLKGGEVDINDLPDFYPKFETSQYHTRLYEILCRIT